MKDLTVGHPGKVLFGYALPLFASVIFQQLYNIADSFVAGQYIGTAALAAVGNAYEITLIYIALAFGCNVGTAVVCARLFGQRDHAGLRTCITTALLFAGALGVALTLAGEGLSGWLLAVINTPDELMRDSQVYLDIYLLSYVFLILYQVATGIFSALGDSRTPFFFLAASSIANIFVDILFVRSFHMGVEGVAWASFLCQSISGTVAVIAVARKARSIRTGAKPALFSASMLRKILSIAVPSAVQQSCISLGNIAIQYVINGFGTSAVGGYAAAVKLNNMCITSVTALGNGMSNFTSQNLGAGKHSRIRQGCRHGLVQGIAFAAVFTLLYQALCQPLLGMFITPGTGAEAQAVAGEALQIGTLFIRIITSFYPVIAIKLIVDGVLRGASLMNQFMIATLTDLALRVALVYTLAPRFGILGVWLAWPIGWVLGVLLSVMFCRRWMRAQPRT